MFIVLNRFQIVSLKYRKHLQVWEHKQALRCELLSELYL